MEGKSGDLELYIHIPFCVRKCGYCDFLSFPSDASAREQYARGLTEEIKAVSALMAGREREVSSIYLGGGTPSVMEPQYLESIMEALGEGFTVQEGAEISMECNPGTVTGKSLAAFRNLGINRLSFGLQSADDSELRCLGRIHTFDQFLENFWEARKAGFSNINVDLMSGLPNQTLQGYERTLQAVVRLEPEHISAYSLILEEGTPFYQTYQSAEAAASLPDEDTERQLYWTGREFLEKEGYVCYEISNFAKPGKECRHNVGYWTGREYIGLGLGASSLLDGYRFRNTVHMEEYLTNAPDPQAIRSVEETVTLGRAMEEFAFLGLRMSEGLDETVFQRRFGRPFENIYGQTAQRLVTLGLLCREGTKLRLTHRGIDVSNLVMAEFLLESDIP